MVNDTEIKNGQEEVGTNKTSELIDTQEGVLDLLRDLVPKNELTNEDINALKILLANNATALLHGKEASSKAYKTALDTFVNKKISDQVNLPVYKIKKSEIDKGFNILDLVVRAKLLNSKSEVRRSIKDKGIKIDDIPIEKDNYLISVADFKDDIDLFKLSHGKKNHVIIKLVN